MPETLLYTMMSSSSALCQGVFFFHSRKGDQSAISPLLPQSFVTLSLLISHLPGPKAKVTFENPFNVAVLPSFSSA